MIYCKNVVDVASLIGKYSNISTNLSGQLDIYILNYVLLNFLLSFTGLLL